ncbi:MAG: radical SAM protein [Candidatus Neomarinimicrobiota bacterium]|jgi:DNA repair photolyase|nr:radical SAM protein [Candidatus Neomarinimicrobiota bacterium]MDD3966742.1 radical SAM protein [Candidatus Neomarinimicrobiota bacterium]
MYKNITCKNALNRLNSNYLPFRWDLNIFRGCEHRCSYCYALYSHEYLQGGDFFRDIFIKENIVEALEQKLRSPFWKRETINLGGVTDSYQPIERQKQFMPEILRLLIRYRTPATISTKSALILRDLDLFEELARVAGADIAFSITTLDENIYKKTEPASAPPPKRFAALREIAKTNIRCGVLCMPILPFLTDSRANLEEVFRLTQESGGNYIYAGLLNLRGPTRGHFLHFIKENFSELYPRYCAHYESRAARAPYRKTIYALLSDLRQVYPLKYKAEPIQGGAEQMELF